MPSHKCWIVVKDHIILPAVCAVTDSAQYGVGLHFYKDALQADVQRVLFSRAAFLSSWCLCCRSWHLLWLNFLGFLSDHPTFHCPYLLNVLFYVPPESSRHLCRKWNISFLSFSWSLMLLYCLFCFHFCLLCFSFISYSD